MPVTDTEFSQSVNPQNFCTGVSLHHQALIQNSGPLIDMSDIRPGTSELFTSNKVQKTVTLSCFLIALTSLRSRVQEEYKISPQLQEQVLQPVDAEPAESEPVNGLGAYSDFRLEDDGLSRHHGH